MALLKGLARHPLNPAALESTQQYTDNNRLGFAGIHVKFIHQQSEVAPNSKTLRESDSKPTHFISAIASSSTLPVVAMMGQ